uniref:Uncharacterized protein n=1 Tax=Rhizophagus irregularis (strain DAOM 181602 / DAOM 197198 / MUCL 43194) TaxID=747089 RepID=U9V167_RHIID
MILARYKGKNKKSLSINHVIVKACDSRKSPCRNTKFLRLCFPQQFDYQLHRISGAEHCFSKLESFRCYANTNKYILEGLAGITQNNLKEVHFIDHTINLRDESFSRPLEESLIKHANTIQYLRIDWKPNTEILSYLVNLISLDINLSLVRDINWNHLEKLSLPLLKFLRTQKVPSRILSNIIENTKGYLTEISILYEAEQRKQKQQELQQLENLIKEYKVKEMIKRYYVDSHGSAFEDFEWIQRRSDAYIEF